MSIATIILAAGGSTRLGGQPKQLLIQDGQPLIRRIVEASLSIQAGPVIAVLGANEDLVRQEINDFQLLTVVNPDWREGLASSLRVGLRMLSDQPIDAFLIVLTDQPYVTADLLQQIITTQQKTGRGIVACRYGESGHLGVPALFDIRYKSEFLHLTGDVGARKLIQQYRNDCAEVSFPLAAVDLDTWEDVKRWREAED
ncbi:nucleotidyltransferase family protein [Spirosoma jeollabukense]